MTTPQPSRPTAAHRRRNVAAVLALVALVIAYVGAAPKVNGADLVPTVLAGVAIVLASVRD